MKIQPSPYLIPERNISFLEIGDLEFLNSFVQYFNNKDFDDRYFSQFEWFKEELSGVESIANLGCGKGRETFALMWKLEATEAVGIDIDGAKIEFATRIAQFRHWFSTSLVPSVRNRNQQAVKLLQEWYEALPIEIREGATPQFYPGNISEGIEQPDNHFNLVYCRFTLWTIAGNDKDSLSSVCRNISRILKPRVGRVVIVEPSKKESTNYDFGHCFREAGLRLDRVEEEKSRLGWLEPFKLETEPKDPKGYIFTKL
jgi:SAM-dependent methyltransferase